MPFSGGKMVLTESDYNTLKHGDRAPDFRLRGTDGNFYSLASFKGSRALLVVFMCNHCPYVKAKVDAINNLAKEYRGRGLAVAGINSNDDSEYPDDSFENMQAWAGEKGFEFHYLRDESQEVAKAYGAVCTPDPFLFDSNFRLAYHGRIDDGHGPDSIATTYELKAAVEQVTGGRKVSVGEHPSMGCSIKWKH
jgi:peroxiredoxin